MVDAAGELQSWQARELAQQMIAAADELDGWAGR
jgi:hypothetical protein